MKELVDVFSSNQVLILGIVMFIFGLILLGYLLTTILIGKKNKVTKIENNSVETSKEPIEETKIQEKEENIEKIEQQEKITNELEEMLDKMQKTLDEKEEIDNIANFEREQEENAIISYQELLKAAKKDFPKMNLNDNKNEIIEINEKEVKTIEIPKKVEIASNDQEENIIEPIEKPISDNEKLEEKKFKSSVFISPLGITNNDNPNYYKEVRIRRDYLKEMADSRFSTVDIQADDLIYEERQNEQFLEDLKNFRNNL